MKEKSLFAYFSIAYYGEVVLIGKLTSPENHPFEVQVDYAKQVIERVLEYLNTTT